MKFLSGQSGFSLVELSIVLVILGLLTGGILAGQALIRASELRGVTTEIGRNQSAIQAFRDKYFGLPGDLNNATKFWGAADTAGAGGECTDSLANAGTGTQTCNGNGNGLVDNNESYQFWEHLANAALIEGSYPGTGTINSTPYPVPIVGTNVPKSKLGNAGWGVFNINGYNIDFDPFTAYTPQAKLFLGSGAMYSDATLSTAESWNIDTKIDDASPALGKMQVQLDGSHGISNGCISSITSAAQYVLTNSGLRCAPSFKILP